MGGELVKVMEPEILKGGELIEAQGRAEIDMQITTAKKYPRVLSKVRDKVFEMAAIDKETAEKCWYALPRDGKVISGPSVRLAEIVVASYQNLRAASRVVAIDDKHVTCQAVCYDLENNVAIQTEVKRRITDRYGNRYSEDMIVTTSNAGNSIAFRNAVFKAIPMVLFKSILDKVKKVGMGDERTFAAERDATINKIVKMGAETKQIAALLGKRGTPDMDTDDVILLKGIITAVEDGDTTIEDAFKAKPKPSTGKIDMAAVKAGDPATHQGHEDKTPMPKKEEAKKEEPAAPTAKTAGTETSRQAPPPREPGEEEPEEAGGGEPEVSEEMEAELASTKDDLQATLAHLSQPQKEAVLASCGILNLESCTDLSRVKRALESAKWAAENAQNPPQPKAKKK